MHGAKIIPFTPQVRAAQPEQQTMEAAEPIRNPRFRGLHVVAAGTQTSSLLDNTQAQARRIVAQVEWEIEQQAVRECQHTFQMLHKDVKPLPAQGMDTPITVAQRLIGALWFFAQSA